MIATLLVAAWLTKNSDYHGYIRHDFQIAGRSALIVEPKVPKAGNPWVLRAEFFDHRPEFDLAMLMRGYRLAFIDVGNVFESFDAFKSNDLRASAGLSLKWQAPVGPIIINLVRPIKKQDGDRTEGIQFSFGQQF